MWSGMQLIHNTVQRHRGGRGADPTPGCLVSGTHTGKTSPYNTEIFKT